MLKISKVIYSEDPAFKADSEHEITLDGKSIGVIMKGWLRLGGEQWVIMCAPLDLVNCGEPTLKAAVNRVVKNHLRRNDHEQV